uniref:Uncharacterized protein n=1 Tax=Acrobeloides nanus TaxID=290746 RepID=A0A914CLY4_9BILA
MLLYRFVDESPKVIIYPDEDAHDADEWGEGFCMTYNDYRRNIVQEQEQRAQLHLVLSRWRKAMEQKYPRRSEGNDGDFSERLSPRASPRTPSEASCRFMYGDISPKIQVNSFPHAVRLWQMYLK